MRLGTLFKLPSLSGLIGVTKGIEHSIGSQARVARRAEAGDRRKKWGIAPSLSTIREDRMPKSGRDGSARSQNWSRRQFMVRSATGVAGAAMSSYGFSWGDLAYAQQAKGKPAKFNVAIRPDWTQGWFGPINEAKGFWKKYLPEGSDVTFTRPIQGGIVTSELISGRTMIGHNGDAPGLIATFQRERTDIRIVGLVGSSPDGYHCYQIIVRANAPEFKSSKEAVKWLDGKIVATPRGSCTDRFLQDVLQREGVKPAQYLNQSIGTITTNLRLGRIDGAATWDPQGAAVSTLAGEGTARVVATGHPWGERDSGTIIARRDFMENEPEIMKAWLKSEIEAQLWYYDPKNHAEVLEIMMNYVPGFSHKALWFSMAGQIPAPYYGGPVRDEKPFIYNDDVRNLQNRVVKFLHERKITPAGELLPGAIDDALAREAMKEMKVSSPLVRMPAVPVDEGYPLVRLPGEDVDQAKLEKYSALFKK